MTTATPAKPDISDASRAHLPLPAVEPLFDPYEFHKLRYGNERASIEHRNESGQWLLDHGFIGFNGKMILIQGVSDGR